MQATRGYTKPSLGGDSSVLVQAPVRRSGGLATVQSRSGMHPIHRVSRRSGVGAPGLFCVRDRVRGGSCLLFLAYVRTRPGRSGRPSVGAVAGAVPARPVMPSLGEDGVGSESRMGRLGAAAASPPIHDSDAPARPVTTPMRLPAYAVPARIHRVSGRAIPAVGCGRIIVPPSARASSRATLPPWPRWAARWMRAPPRRGGRAAPAPPAR